MNQVSICHTSYPESAQQAVDKKAYHLRKLILIFIAATTILTKKRFIGTRFQYATPAIQVVHNMWLTI